MNHDLGGLNHDLGGLLNYKLTIKILKKLQEILMF